MNAPRYEVVQGDSGAWHWRLRAGNGELLAHSELYPDKATAEAGVDAAVRASMESEHVRERYYPPEPR